MEIEYKGYRLIHDNYCMVRITQIGKGAIPLQLRGDFTNQNVAKTAIDSYLELKGVKDGKPSSGSAD